MSQGEKLNENTAKHRNPLLWGAAGSLALFVAYFGILAVANSPGHAISQFFDMWYWIIPLTAGFGIQIGLYTHIKNSACANHAVAAEIAATGGVSAGSMLACCAHHITDVLPIIGLSAAALFLEKYQAAFLVLGLFSNLVGIVTMLNIIQTHNLFDEQSSFGKIFRYDLKPVKTATIAVSVIVVSLAFIMTIL